MSSDSVFVWKLIEVECDMVLYFILFYVLVVILNLID